MSTVLVGMIKTSVYIYNKNTLTSMTKTDCITNIQYERHSMMIARLLNLQ